MMKVNSKNEDLLEANAGLQTDNTRLQADATRLQSEVKKLQQESKGKSTDFDADLQVPYYSAPLVMLMLHQTLLGCCIMGCSQTLHA